MRRVRSFECRTGRLTSAQRRALEQRLPHYEVPADTVDLRAAFERAAPLVAEIGFGNGDALSWMATNEPEKNFVGMEVHKPGVGRLLNRLDAAGLTNVRVIMRDAVDVLGSQAAPASLDEVRIYFPDPWPKKRHHKRRLIQPAFLEQLAVVMRPQGILHLATDWRPYAQWMLEALAQVDAFRIQGRPWSARPDWRPQTHFERRGLGRGHEIFDIVCRLSAGA
ncbi:MAG TPA: tRNA (guanosine(46)-N7)-methyltransferase TrmB [Wenzhouxiangella sp.]|nr:tRNA (guanosine(46)-N7)-methyltransferase TrmB [Wenzhouxiangella sp.]